MSFGTYMLKVGDLFYVGSSLNLKKRKQDHFWNLKNGTHHVKRLQNHYNKIQLASFVVIHEINVSIEKCDKCMIRQAIQKLEQSLIDMYYGDHNFCNTSKNAKGPDSEIAKKRWKNESYRKKVTDKLKSRIFTKESRQKMSESKKGIRNPKSRKVIVENPDGTQTTYNTVTDAAKFFGVSQQLMDQWLKGIVSWPSETSKVRTKNKWIINYKAKLI
jgi:hypothetical protein